jgi:hypothetical protein
MEYYSGSIILYVINVHTSFVMISDQILQIQFVNIVFVED